LFGGCQSVFEAAREATRRHIKSVKGSHGVLRGIRRASGCIQNVLRRHEIAFRGEVRLLLNDVRVLEEIEIVQ
jgi:hypothetical protein